MTGVNRQVTKTAINVGVQPITGCPGSRKAGELNFDVPVLIGAIILCIRAPLTGSDERR